MNTLTKKYIETRQQTVALCKPLQVEDYTPQSAIFSSPPKWHIAHVTWFFEEMILKNHVPDYKVFNKDFGFLFNSYYNSIGERIERNNRGLLTRPKIETIYDFRAYVDKAMIELLESTSDEDIISLTILGINHEQQHQELLVSDIKYTLSFNPLYPKLYEKNYVSHFNNTEEWLTIDEGIYTIGHDSNDFCFDNELGVHRVFLEPYEISSGLVTYGDFMAFIDDDGYKKPEYWLDEGWFWINDNKIGYPLYWKKVNNQWHHYTLSGLETIDKNAILTHISFYEASAFAQWKGCRLPTEFEWEVASKQLNWGSHWEWTNSAYLPYPKFKTAEGAVGEYNGKFMINQMVLRGASSATAPNHSRHTYRNFFHPQAQWQFSGIRLAR
ncbi:ergothioneine biosynthesis protein EgtB [Gelidibacter japonicus]|jgi:ergothioneine biosynthesis protein EgtB|uniref:ergothioneine biosynthesis protein EgtB n=1 Tax=Gelidibacter japonicus TaxID=1962232 RepID=UPI0013D5862C|nr:ergothioneine biosynthesis protein EgtB [Gelidibacter japonicus]MCL8007779.1 ergothioneine biosynthesis protein EgtB [Gelidibacter japonicus]